MRVRLLAGDCLAVLPTLRANSVDACVCDPPYHLASIVKRFGGKGAAPAKFGRDGAFARASAGFMGQAWDGGDLAFQPETWAAVLRVLKPGAFLTAFGAPKNYHRLAVAIEDAGFELRDSLMWVFGSGFPKRRDQLKPAFEPIVLARKPLSERSVAANVARWGTGALNIDAGRVNGGRWPANLLHDGSDDVVAAFPDRAVAPGGPRRGGLGYGGSSPQTRERHPGSSGSAARFFYCAKASKAERNGSKHPTVKPLELKRYLVRLVTPERGVVVDPFAGTGTTGEAAALEGRRAILIERESAYRRDVERRLARMATNS